MSDIVEVVLDIGSSTVVEVIERGLQGIPGPDGADGADGPNIITPTTDVSFLGTGLLGHAGGKATSVDSGQLLAPYLLAALAETTYVPRAGGTMTGNLVVPSVTLGGIDGPRLDRSGATVRVRNNADTTEAPFSAGLITASSQVLSPTENQQSTLRVNQSNGNNAVSLGTLPSPQIAFGALYCGNIGPSPTNYAVASDSTITLINGTSSVRARINNTDVLVITDTGVNTSNLDLTTRALLTGQDGNGVSVHSSAGFRKTVGGAWFWDNPFSNGEFVFRSGTGFSERFRINTAGDLVATRLIGLGTFTVATLPAASANLGRIAQVTDSSVTANGTTVAGGGANRVMVFSNGTNWRVVVS
jgi:hypothetical protein